MYWLAPFDESSMLSRLLAYYKLIKKIHLGFLWLGLLGYCKSFDSVFVDESGAVDVDFIGGEVKASARVSGMCTLE